MSLYDPPKQESLSDVFPQGTLFWLIGAKYEGIQDTAYGPGPQAAILVCAVGDEQNARQFRVWGALAEQVGQMEDGDIPAEVEVGKMGRKNVFKLSKSLRGEVQKQQVSEEDDIPF